MADRDPQQPRRSKRHEANQLPSPSTDTEERISTSHQSPEPYQYQHLQEEQEIRLLKVDPGTPWTYEIIHTSLAQASPFQTLSYVWGLDTRDQLLTLHNGKVIMINKNLAKALPYLSSRCDTGYLWID